MAKSRAGERTRTWATVFYTDSAPVDWLDIISSWHVPSFVSPYHDSDTRPDGEPKKPHYHLELMFSSPKTPEQVRELINQINAVGCEWVNDTVAYARYLCHLDEHDKHIYDVSEVIEFSGADYMEMISRTSDDLQVLKDMQKWCRENGVTLYCDLVDYAAEYEPVWYRALATKQRENMWKYLRSREHAVVSHIPPQAPSDDM